MIAVVAGGGGLAVYLIDQFFHQFRDSRLVVIPGGVSYRLLAAPGVTPVKDTRLDSVDVDGIVADLHNAQAASRQIMAEHGLPEVPIHHAGYMYELLTARVLLGEDYSAEPDVRNGRYYPHIKRVIDLILLGLSLPIGGPILAGTAFAIWLDSGEQVFT